MKLSKQEQDDWEANQFAMELLIPVPMLKAFLTQMAPFDLADDKPVKRLAKFFEVPHTVMAFRLGALREEGVL